MYEQDLNIWCSDIEKRLRSLETSLSYVKATNYLLVALEIGTLAAIIGLIIH
jgi:hypothetical protein